MHPARAADIDLYRFDDNQLVKLIGVHIAVKMFDSALEVRQNKEDGTHSVARVNNVLYATDSINKQAVQFFFQYWVVPYGCRVGGQVQCSVIETVSEIKWRHCAGSEEIQAYLGQLGGKKNKNGKKDRRKDDPKARAATKRRYYGLTWSEEFILWARRHGFSALLKQLGQSNSSSKVIKYFEDQCVHNYGVPYVYEAFVYPVDPMLKPPSMCKDVFQKLFLKNGFFPAFFVLHCTCTFCFRIPSPKNKKIANKIQQKIAKRCISDLASGENQRDPLDSLDPGRKHRNRSSRNSSNHNTSSSNRSSSNSSDNRSGGSTSGGSTSGGSTRPTQQESFPDFTTIQLNNHEIQQQALNVPGETQSNVEFRQTSIPASQIGTVTSEAMTAVVVEQANTPPYPVPYPSYLNDEESNDDATV